MLAVVAAYASCGLATAWLISGCDSGPCEHSARDLLEIFLLSVIWPKVWLDLGLFDLWMLIAMAPVLVTTTTLLVIVAGLTLLVRMGISR